MRVLWREVAFHLFHQYTLLKQQPLLHDLYLYLEVLCINSRLSSKRQSEFNLYFVVCWSLAAQGIKHHQFSDFPVIGLHDQINQAHEVRPNQADCEKITTKDVAPVMENVPRRGCYS